MLRSELAALYEKREHMLSFEKSQLLAEYVKWIGTFQHEEFSLQISIKRLQRKSQIIQACINRDEPIVVEAIEQQLDQEFAKYERILQQQLEDIKAAEELLAAPVLSEEDSEEIKSLYRILVTRQHPDWNPNLTQEERDLFVRVQAAYKSANLQELRNILLLLDAKETIKKPEQDLAAEIDKYEKSVADIKERIEKIEQSFPYQSYETVSFYLYL